MFVEQLAPLLACALCVLSDQTNSGMTKVVLYFQGQAIRICRRWETLLILFHKRRSHLRGTQRWNSWEGSRPQRPLQLLDLHRLVGLQRLRPVCYSRSWRSHTNIYTAQSIAKVLRRNMLQWSLKRTWQYIFKGLQLLWHVLHWLASLQRLRPVCNNQCWLPYMNIYTAQSKAKLLRRNMSAMIIKKNMTIYFLRAFNYCDMYCIDWPPFSDCGPCVKTSVDSHIQTSTLLSQ